MFDLGGTELLLIGVVALVVVGPKELPTMFRAIGLLTGRAREMAREFTSAMNSAADQSGLQEINKTIKAATNPANFGMNKLKEASGLKTPTPAKPAAAIPAAGTPITPAPVTPASVTPAGLSPIPSAAPAPALAVKPGGETEELAAKLAANKARNAEAAAARKAAREAAAAAAVETPAPVAAEPAPVVKKPARPRAKKAAPTPPPADETP